MHPRVERAVYTWAPRRVRGSNPCSEQIARLQGSKLQESRYRSAGLLASLHAVPQIRSKSKPQPLPCVQPAASSAAVQSLAPAPSQMALASAKVLPREHGQPASDSPHTEQPGRRDPQAGEGLTSTQHRTCGRVCGGSCSKRTSGSAWLFFGRAQSVVRWGVTYCGSAFAAFHIL